MALIKPRAIPPAAHIAVLAASGPSNRERIEEAARVLEERGHRVTLAANIDQRSGGYLAGNDGDRAAEVNRLLRSPEFDAYFFARGGYGAMRILDAIDWNAIAANPRPVVGFSDVTAIHQAMATQANVAGFHGPMLNLDFHARLSPEHDRWLWALLQGESPLVYSFERNQVLQAGEAVGQLFGGCLALTTSLAGTPYDFWLDEGIWFWEDVDEPIYRIDRMLTHLRLSGRMRHIRGVVIGRLKDCGNEPDLLEMLREFFGSYAIPVVTDVPFGHHGDNLMMPIGATVRLSTSDRTLTITESVVVR
jgi:muramoyltetrapeptide carboxypeptidase